MILKIYKKNYNTLNNNLELKIFLLELLKISINNILYIFKIDNNYLILNKIFLKFYNFNNFNNLCIYISYIINLKFIIKINIFKLFFINNNNIILINNIKKVFINRLSNNYGLFFNKINNNYIYCNYFKNKKNIISIILKNNDLFLKFNNEFKINFIKFLNIFGFSNNYIYYNSNSEIYKKYVINNIINNLLYINNKKLNKYLNILNYKDLINMLKIFKILLKIKYNKLNLTDIDHFNNRYLETWKNFIYENFLIGLDRNINNLNKFININNTLIENILTNPLLQILNTNNTNFNLNSKINKISLIGPGSLFNKNNFNLKLKSLHLSQLGNICLLDTYENFKCGLILNLPINSFINKNGELISEFNYINKNKIRYNKFYLKNKNLEKYKINFYNINLKKNIIFNINSVISLYKGEFFIKNINNKENFIFKKFSNLFSYIINFIPFLNFNDPIRILMGSKMLNQSLQLLFNEDSLVKSNNYYNKFNFKNIKSLTDGVVIKLNKFFIKIRTFNNKIITYYLNINYKCCVWEGEKILIGDIIAININDNKYYGKNLLISYNYFNGYEFEDAFIINNNLIYNYIMSSLKFNNYIIKFIKNKNIIEYSSFNIPKLNNKFKYNINKNFGLPKKNKYLNNKYIIIGKIMLKNLSNLSNYNIFGFILNKIINKSFYLNYNNNLNKIIKIIINKSFNLKYFLNINLISMSLNNLNIGDKLSGRYGNKGVISLILNKIDLPYSIKGYIPDILINPLSVPSRMNIGQLYEGLFGFIALILNKKFLIDLNLIINYNFIKNLTYSYINILKKFNYNSYFKLKNPYNGYYFLNKNFIINSYFLKLMHLSSEKINKRSLELNNKYYTITQQPLKGTKNKGGQRFGEMELWALNSYRSVYNINELFNFKSDNIIFRYNYFKDKINYKKFYFSESYITLLKELSSLLIEYKPLNIIFKN